MSDSNDYEDDLEVSTSFCQFERPLFLRQRNVEKKSNKRKRVQKPVKKDVPKQSTPLVLIHEDPVIRKKEQKSTSLKLPTKGRYVEYGDPVSGYKFILTEQEYSKLKKNEQPIESFDPHAYDCVKPSAKVSSKSNIMIYWDQERTLRLPLVCAVAIDEIDIEDITTDSVKEFYLRSSSEQGLDYGTILKGERIKWHPDRLVGQKADVLRKVTRLFQIINELWESHTYSST